MSSDVPKNKIPGESRKGSNSYGYRSDGYLIHNKDVRIYITIKYKLKLSTSEFRVGDVIGCGFSVLNKRIFFTVNGTLLKREFSNVEVEKLIPAIGLKNISSQAQFNFGASPFIFNIREYAKELLQDLYQYLFYIILI